MNRLPLRRAIARSRHRRRQPARPHRSDRAPRPAAHPLLARRLRRPAARPDQPDRPGRTAPAPSRPRRPRPGTHLDPDRRAPQHQRRQGQAGEPEGFHECTDEQGFSRTPWISPSSSRPEESSDCRAADSAGGSITRSRSVTANSATARWSASRDATLGTVQR